MLSYSLKANDWNQKKLLPEKKLLAPDIDKNLKFYPGMETSILQSPDQFHFLHETAIAEYHGVLFSAWYNCEEKELSGYTPIRGRRSYDKGKSWTPVEILAEDPQRNMLYCPPSFGICDDVLYLMLNTMTEFDCIHSLDIYRYEESAGTFFKIRSSPIPFKLNTNVYSLPNGKLFLPGRTGKLDQKPEIPAALLSDSGKIDSEWRLVPMQKDNLLPDGSPYVYPETSSIINGNEIWTFCRNDPGKNSLLYISEDYGENWKLYQHDIPFMNSKIYSGTLSDGRNYIIGNLQSGENRSRLAIFFTEPGSMQFKYGALIQNGFEPDDQKLKNRQWSYPVCWEHDNKLFVIYTKNKSHAMLSIIPLK